MKKISETETIGDLDLIPTFYMFKVPKLEDLEYLEKSVMVLKRDEAIKVWNKLRELNGDQDGVCILVNSREQFERFLNERKASDVPQRNK